MSTVDGPVGAAASGTRIDLKSPARVGGTRISARLAGQLALVTILAAGTLLCLAAVDTNTLLPDSIRPVIGLPLAGPFGSIRIHLHSGEVLGALTLMFLGYVVAVRHAERIPPRQLLGAIGLFMVVVVLAPPLFSTDLFSYQEYARMFFGYHANPYTHAAQVLGGEPQYSDPLYNYIGSKWISTPSVYGPLFTLLSGLFQNSSSDGAIAFSAYAYKVIAALSCAAIIWMTWRAARLRGLEPTRGAALIGLNPLVILYGIGGGHNDLLMMVFSTGAIWALLARRERTSGALAVLAAAIKLTGGLVLPFALAANPGLGSRSRRAKIAFGAAVTGIITLGVGLSVFGTDMINMLNTLSQVQGEGGWQSVPGFLSTAFWHQTASHLISLLFGLVFMAICLRLLWRVWIGQLDWLDGLGWTTFWLLATTSTILPWYVSWLLVPVALSTRRKLWSAALWFTAWVQATTMIVYLPHPPVILGFST